VPLPLAETPERDERLSLAVFQSIGPLELGIVLLIVLLIVGPKRLPGLGRQLGSGMREFKDSLTKKVDEDLEERPDGSLDGDVVSERERSRS
jgi:TatA/E family protein of Tat protein translocase